MKTRSTQKRATNVPEKESVQSIYHTDYDVRIRNMDHNKEYEYEIKSDAKSNGKGDAGHHEKRQMAE